MTDKTTKDTLLDEEGIRITAETVETPRGDYAMSDIIGVSRKIYQPLWGPFLLASLGTLNLVAAVQTLFWGDWLASAVMLGVGIFWRVTGTRHTLLLQTADKTIDAWYTADRKKCDRALTVVQRTIT